MGASAVRKPVVYCISGYKNSGKTTLMTALVSELAGRGLRVATIKHDGHDFEPDVQGTDSWRHRQAGAYASAVFSESRVMITRTWEQPDLSGLLQAFSDADVILIEGMKDSGYPKTVCRWPEESLPDPSNLADRIAAMIRAEC